MRKNYLALAAGTLILAMCTGVCARPTMLYGEITAINYTTMTLELEDIVGVTTVQATKDTTVLICGEVASFDELKKGQSVKVVGTTVDGKFIATRICVQGDQNGRPRF